MPAPKNKLERIRDAIQGRYAVVVTGAGVSVATSGEDPASDWRGLIETGITFCEDNATPDEKWRRRIRADVDDKEWVDAASKIEKLLRPKPGLFAKWLAETIGRLPVVDDGVIRAIDRLNCPIVTTNYDSLVEQVIGGNCDTVTWKQPDQYQPILRRRDRSVIHLHGSWRDVDSIVFGERSYQRLLDDGRNQAFLRSLALDKTLLFVGCGATVSDPNFGELLGWLRQTFDGSLQDRHVLLCRKKDEAVLAQELQDDPIDVVSYGAGYSDLVPFLDDIAPDDTSSDPTRADWTSWLDTLERRTSELKIVGISTTPGKTRVAARHDIETLYTPLRSRDHPLHGSAEREAETDLPRLLREHRHLLLEGQPGAGKTTFLRYVACLMARIRLGDDRAARATLAWPEDKSIPMPVFVRLSELVPVLTEDGSAKGRGLLLDHLVQGCTTEGHAITRNHWSDLLESGDATLLLDGLDEVADDTLRDRLFDVFQDIVAKWSECRIVVTSRPIQTADLLRMNFHHAVVEVFRKPEIQEFVRRWVMVLFEPDDADGETYRVELEDAILSRPRLRLMAENPVMLTALCIVHWNEGGIPDARSRVYRAVVRWLIAARSAQRKAAGFNDAFAENALARLALEMMKGAGSTSGKQATFGLEHAAEVVVPVVAREFPAMADDKDLDEETRNARREERLKKARAWLRFETTGSGVIEELGAGTLRFWHLTFQEFLAALQLAWRGDDKDAGYWPEVAPRLESAQWRETIQLLPGCLHDEGGRGRVDRLLRRIVRRCEDEDDSIDGELLRAARIAGGLGAVLQTMAGFEYQPEPDVAETYEAALRKSMALFSVEGAARVSWQDRIAAAEALGRAGDPRLAPENFDDSFIALPEVPGVRLSKYPVTVEEYQRFVDDDGYESDEWWSDEGKSWRTENEVEVPYEWFRQLETPNRPIVYVCLHEAEAYCAWMTERRDLVDRAGCRVALPDDEIWQAAAMPDGREYPWGTEPPDEERANFDQRVGATSPVGVFPAKAGKYGHFDLGGNVWELSAECDDDGDPIARGGAWVSSAEYLRAAFRFSFNRWRCYNSLGFRVCVVPVSR